MRISNFNVLAASVQRQARGRDFLSVFLLCLVFLTPYSMKAQQVAEEKVRVSLQKRVPSDLDTGAYVVASQIQAWEPQETAIIICDMWDKHWCTGATARVAEMAPRLNEVISIARQQGVLIVHAPSDCMDYYKDHPARKLAQKYNSKKYEKLISGDFLDSEKGAQWPVDQSDEGCEEPDCKPHRAWTKQIDALEIHDTDAISDSGAELAALFEKRGIKNVILTGVHTNMCVIGRSFGLRSMVRLGKNVALMRDMTDLMYNHEMWPYVDHFSGLDLMVEYIETYVCPSMVSTDFTGKKQFRFQGDKRPRIAMLTAESEYRANQRLAEFAHELTLKHDIHTDFALGIPIMSDAKKDAEAKVKAEYEAYGMPIDTDGKTLAPTRHNLENLQILEDADLALFFIRRRALEPEKMEMIKNYVSGGKPVLAIRTASHSFDAKGNVPREGGGVQAAGESVSGFLAQWPEFDQEVLGGNYQGHYGHLEELTKVEIVPGMEGHPLLEGVPAEGFGSPNWLYKNRPLRSDKAQVLMTATIPGELPEPVLWINKTSTDNDVIYTSLGHWDDWEIDAFRQIMVNSVKYLLKGEK